MKTFVELSLELSYKSGKSVEPYVAVSLVDRFIGLWRPEEGLQIQSISDRNPHNSRATLEHAELEQECLAVWNKNHPDAVLKTLVERIDGLEKLIKEKDA